MTLIKHFPALQVLLPFFGALLAALTFNRIAAKLIATFSSILGLLLSVYCLPYVNRTVLYRFGGWAAPVGIEYKIDYLNQPVIIFINAVLTFFLLFNRELIKISITDSLIKGREHLFFSLLLFAHAGYVGIISTNDLFNLYVFIEISSLATYILLSTGNKPESSIGAFDYLMLGTIGATLILISIGYFLALTGSLNADDIAQILKTLRLNKTLSTAIIFFIIGAILKVAFFPMHFWMIRAYCATSSVILTYFTASSTVIGTYIILRFLHFIIPYESAIYAASMIIKPLALITILICTFIALHSTNLKSIIVYSAASQIGYVFLLLSIPEAQTLMIQFLLLDAINKIAMFSLAAHIESKVNDLTINNFPLLSASPLFKILVILILLFSAGLPLTSMFMLKVRLYDFLISSNFFVELFALIIGSATAVLYHLKIAKLFFFASGNNGVIKIDTKLTGLIFIVGLQILTLFFMNNLSNYILRIRDLL